MSDIESTFWRSFDTNVVQVFGINASESIPNTINFANSLGVTFPILMDRGRRFYNIYGMWGISPFPRDVIIDQQGIIRYQSSEYNPQHMQNIINQLLKTNDSQYVIPETFGLNVYPNPFNSKTNIEFVTKLQGKYDLILYDITGKIVFKDKLENLSANQKFEYPLDLNSFASGLYVVSISNQKFSESKKMILMK